MFPSFGLISRFFRLSSLPCAGKAARFFSICKKISRQSNHFALCIQVLKMIARPLRTRTQPASFKNASVHGAKNAAAPAGFARGFAARIKTLLP
jgi:hypothetical protein